jgi:broad specificity phosphatase PhoE
MSTPLPELCIVRHGETEWTLSGQHTGLTDIPLTAHGEEEARRVRSRLQSMTFAKVLTSPLQRATRTCELAGYGSVAEIDRDLVEWNYGDYEGKKTSEIVATRPGWFIFRDGCPNGESPRDIGARADRLVARVRKVNGNVLVFSSGHISRVIIARWLGLETAGGRYFKLEPAAITLLGYEHNDPEQPYIETLNQTV